MALSRCGLAGGKKSMFDIIDAIPSVDFITTGLTVYSSRVTIQSGGYCIKNGYVYGKMNLKSNFNFDTTNGLGIYNLPDLSDNTKKYGSVTYEDNIEGNYLYNAQIDWSSNRNVRMMFSSLFTQNSEGTFYFMYPTSAT